MIRGLAKVSSRARPVFSNAQKVRFSTKSWVLEETEEWSIFPRQREGNIYVHNWSMCEDGVAPVGDAYRNARLQLLTTAMGAKVNGGKIEQTSPQYFGKYEIDEAGDHLTHEMFSEIFSTQQQYLSSGLDLYVEDAVLGSDKSTRNGVRVTSCVPALTLIARSLLIPTPPYKVDHRARFKGWNFDPRWSTKVRPVWNGKHYDHSDKLPPVPQPGQRPIVAFVGNEHSISAVQFVEDKGEIVGANVIVGAKVPVRGFVDAVGHAGCVLANTQHPNAVALPCMSLTKGADTAVVLGADDEILNAAAKAGLLYGAYHNIISLDGVSAMWGGYIADAADAQETLIGSTATPVVVVAGKAAVHNYPNNIAHPAKHIVFYEKGAAKSKISADEAVKRVVLLSEDTKTDAINAILKGASISIIGSPADLKTIF